MVFCWAGDMRRGYALEYKKKGGPVGEGELTWWEVIAMNETDDRISDELDILILIQTNSSYNSPRVFHLPAWVS